jgi:hypothetical protein
MTGSTGAGCGCETGGVPAGCTGGSPGPGGPPACRGKDESGDVYSISVSLASTDCKMPPKPNTTTHKTRIRAKRPTRIFLTTPSPTLGHGRCIGRRVETEARFLLCQHTVTYRMRTLFCCNRGYPAQIIPQMSICRTTGLGAEFGACAIQFHDCSRVRPTYWANCSSEVVWGGFPKPSPAPRPVQWQVGKPALPARQKSWTHPCSRNHCQFAFRCDIMALMTRRFPSEGERGSK